MDELAEALADAGGVGAPREHGGRLRRLLAAELRRGAHELGLRRSGYGAPVTVAVAAAQHGAGAPRPARRPPAAPVAPRGRARGERARARCWRRRRSARSSRPADPEAPWPPASWGDALGPAPGGPRRRRARRPSPSRSRSPASTACAPARSPSRPTCWPTRPTCGRRSARHPLRIAVARRPARRPPGRPARGRGARGGRAGPRSARTARRVRPHDDPDPARRVARRILQRLDGMGKWGGYHTEFAHLARGFAGNDRRSGRGRRRGAARRRACSPRSRASASATSSSTRAARATSTR